MVAILSSFAGTQGLTIVFSLVTRHCLALVSFHPRLDNLRQNETRLNDRQMSSQPARYLIRICQGSKFLVRKQGPNKTLAILETARTLNLKPAKGHCFPASTEASLRMSICI